MLNYEYPPLGGGASPITGALAEQLAGAGNDVDVITMHLRGLPRFEEHGRLRVYRVPGWRRSQVVCSTPEMFTYLLPAWVKALQLYHQRPYDLIHAHFILPTSPVGVLLRALKHLPLVVTIHGSDVPGYNPDRFKLGHRLLHPAWRWLTTQADAIISPSLYLAQLLQRSSNVPVDVIPYGFEAPAAPPVERQRRLLVVSRLFPRKGVHHFLDALVELPLEGWEVIVAGDGPARAMLEAQANSLGLPVKFMGFVKGNTLAELYASSAIFVLPSLRDNFPVVLLEAMSAGCAVIAHQTGGIPEVVGNGGILTPPGDVEGLRAAMRSLMADEQAQQKYRDAARERIKQLRWMGVLDAHLRVYERVIQSATPLAKRHVVQ